LHFIGEAAGVKEGGVLDPVFTELQVQCAPENIPESIEIDVSNLQAGDSLRVQDLVLPEGVTALSEPENTVVAIAAPLSVTQTEDDEVEATAAGEATEST
jgi:large subunit ribosomal protein L25